MNRTDRLLAIVLELQNNGRRRAEDLAVTFETSKRTIYRDLQALSEAGVPLLAIPGQGYELMEGYFLPPLSFSSEEASVLLLGSDFVSRSFEAAYQSIAQSASRKIEGVLPQKLREEVRRRQDSIRFIASGNGSDSLALKELRRAVLENRTVEFCYQGRYHQEISYRTADPYGLAYYDGAWYLVAYCHLRQDIRHFRLERLNELSLTAKTFIRPADFNLRQGQPEQERPILIQVQFDNEAARRVKESRYFYITAEENNHAGLLVTLRVRQEQDALGWLLGWGSHAFVLEPASLRQRLIEEAEQLLQKYQICKTDPASL